MDTVKKKCLKFAGDEQGSKVLIKREVEWLAEESRPPGLAYQEFKLNKELLAIKTEEDPVYTDAKAIAVQGFTPVPQTVEYLKTELILDEEWIDNMNNSEANCKQNVLANYPLVGAGLTVKKSETGELSSPCDSSKRLGNVEVHMVSNHLGEAQSITPGPPTPDDDSINSNQRSTFICEECGSSFTQKRYLKMHMLRKHLRKAQAIFECEICSRSFMTKAALKVHIRIHSEDRRREFACDFCGKTFYEKCKLNRHKNTHTGDRYACKVCGDGFMRMESLKAHMVRSQHFDKTQQFTPQNSKDDVSSMKTELISDEEFIDVGNGSASAANTEGTQQAVLAGDNKQQTGVDTAMDSVTCGVCHNSYPRELIKAHIRHTHNDETFKCKICSRSCKNKWNLKEHLRLHSKDRKPEFACDLCDRDFYYKCSLASHKKSHSGDLYACKVCGKRFTLKKTLKRHMVLRQHFDEPQQFTPQSSNNDVPSIKIELMSDEEFIDEGKDSESVSHAEGTQQAVVPEDNKPQTGVDNIYPGELINTHTNNDETYRCQFCLRYFKTQKNLKAHLRIHSKDRRREFACDLCGKSFYANSQLNRHKKIHAGDRYACKVCGHLFTQREQLKSHMVRRQHFDKPQPFTPQSANNDVISGAEFMAEGEETQRPTLAGDNKQKTRVDTAMESVTCEANHPSYLGELIKDHMRLKHNAETYKCQFCPRSLNTNADLKKHLRIHSKDRRREFACDLCGKTFYQKHKLNSHKKIHTGERYTCKVCGDLFTRKDNLKKHLIRRQHFDKTQQFTSQSSNKDAASMKTELMSDEEFMDEGNDNESVSHSDRTQQPTLAGDNDQQTGVDSVTCEVCHNSYPGELIKDHMRLKHNAETYKCQFCSGSYSSKGYLKVHLRLHSKDRRREFACDLCGKTFHHKKNLNIHKKTHTGVRYPCKVCGDDFIHEESLKKHMARRQHFEKSQQLTP